MVGHGRISKLLGELLRLGMRCDFGISKVSEECLGHAGQAAG